MPIVWTTPRTWSTNDLADETLLNTYLRDNLLALKNPPAVEAEGTSNISTTSTSQVPMTDMAQVIGISASSRVLVGFSAPMVADADTRTLLMTIALDTVLSLSVCRTEIGTNVRMLSFLARLSGIAGGNRQVALYWSTSAGTMSQNGGTIARRFFASEWL